MPFIVTPHGVASVYARRGKNRMRYRVVDEYAGDTLSERNTRTSRRSLTLGVGENTTQRLSVPHLFLRRS